jgi:hypothetical protein
MSTPLNIYAVAPGERSVLVREAIHMSENVILIANEVSDPFALVAAESESRADEIGMPLFMFD